MSVSLSRNDIRKIEIRNPSGLNLLHQERIEISPQPIGIGKPVRGAGGNQQFLAVRGIGDKFLTRIVFEITKPSFDPANDLGMRLLPAAITRERIQPGQIITGRQIAEQQVGNRRGGFADGKTGMTPLLHQTYGKAAAMQKQRGKRAPESGAGYKNITVISLFRHVQYSYSESIDVLFDRDS